MHLHQEEPMVNQPLLRPDRPDATKLEVGRQTSGLPPYGKPVD